MPNYGSGSGRIRPQTSWPFSPAAVGPHYEQPVPSQFVQDLETGEPAILPWGKTYADVVSGSLTGYTPSQFGPPPPYLSYRVGDGGIIWSTDPADQPLVFSRVPPGNPPNYFPGGGLYEGYKGTVAANYYVPDFSPTGAFPSVHPADAVKNLELFDPGSPYIDCFDRFSGEALCATPAYPKGPPRLNMTPGSSGGAPIPAGGSIAAPGDVAAPSGAPVFSGVSPLVLVAGVILLLVFLGPSR